MRRKLFCWVASGGGAERQSSQSGFSSKKVRILTKRHRQFSEFGSVAERFNVPVLKTGVRLRGPEVRILSLPPKNHVKTWFLNCPRIIIFYPLATANPQTWPAPLAFNTLAHSFKVAPVVTTSSIKIIFCLFKFSPCQAKQP